VKNNVNPQCARCETKKCYDGIDCFGQRNNHKKLYRDAETAKLHKAASSIEARYYGKDTRLGEIILFAKELGCKRVGLAFCIGLSEEAVVIDEILSGHFEVISVCCKACALEKKDFDLETISSNEHEIMCNPAGQASLLNQAGTELNILCGLCVGHDAIFVKESNAPVTTLIAKDRVLAHNPAGAVYSRYVRRTLLNSETLAKLKSPHEVMSERGFKATEINVGYHPDGFRIDRTASAMNRYTQWEIFGERQWQNPTSVCFDSLPEEGWLKADGFDWNEHNTIKE